MFANIGVHSMSQNRMRWRRGSGGRKSASSVTGAHSAAVLADGFVAEPLPVVAERCGDPGVAGVGMVEPCKERGAGLAVELVECAGHDARFRDGADISESCREFHVFSSVSEAADDPHHGDKHQQSYDGRFGCHVASSCAHTSTPT
jgi:hypothetical protein